MEYVKPARQKEALNPSLSLWIREQSTAFECAKEIINDMVAICTSVIDREKSEAKPDLLRLADLYIVRLKLLRERHGVQWGDQQVIAKVCRVYGAKIQLYFRGGQCPV
jgi:hypothetical protein